MVAVNTVLVKRANHTIRVGDTIAVPQGAFRRTVRVIGFGARRGPPAEAQLLYQETAGPVRLSELAGKWTPLLMNDEPQSDPAATAERDRKCPGRRQELMVTGAKHIPHAALRSAPRLASENAASETGTQRATGGNRKRR